MGFLKRQLTLKIEQAEANYEKELQEHSAEWDRRHAKYSAYYSSKEDIPETVKKEIKDREEELNRISFGINKRRDDRINFLRDRYKFKRRYQKGRSIFAFFMAGASVALFGFLEKDPLFGVLFVMVLVLIEILLVLKEMTDDLED